VMPGRFRILVKCCSEVVTDYAKPAPEFS
jgi:hypothetical protein